MRKWQAMLALWLVAGTAFAQQGYVGIERRLTPEQLKAIGLTAQQVELLDRYLSENQAAAPPLETARYPGVPAMDAAGRPRDPSSLLGLNDQPIRSRLKGAVAGWQPGTVFALENGQQWRVLKGAMILRKPLEAPEIQVIPGVAGRWFLQVDDDLPKARVYRID